MYDKRNNLLCTNMETISSHNAALHSALRPTAALHSALRLFNSQTSKSRYSKSE